MYAFEELGKPFLVGRVHKRRGLRDLSQQDRFNLLVMSPTAACSAIHTTTSETGQNYFAFKTFILSCVGPQALLTLYISSIAFLLIISHHIISS